MKVPYVGVLLNRAMYKGIPAGKTQTEVLAFYEEGGKLHGLKPCYFRLEDVQPGKSTLWAYVKKGEKYRRMIVPVPKVIHNRALYFSNTEKGKLNSLTKDNIIVFNRWNRYSKPYVQDLLWSDALLRPHLAYTVRGTVENLQMMMKKYRQLFIKPNSGSIGFGIMRLARQKDGWRLSYAVYENKKRIWRNLDFKGQIPALLRTKLRSGKYHIQQQLPLATYKGRPFDLRVSVQKDATGHWQVTGMVGKAAPQGRFLSNVGQGGRVYPLSVLLTDHPKLERKAVEKAVEMFALRVVYKLERSIEGLADVGLDIGLTEGGTPLFIECNGRDQRYSFRNGKMTREWKATYANPIGYARYLLSRAREE
ncbi:YheC/YheD family protein [Aneurinibacillus uraniidurans]|uniref:YheC/YheD family endospore coat-associated protein n=1 Tax=Aneurinibacillus uraniidurans TaxID=2966586 RepID=UPI002348FDE6|nr:YheC/YheD family protein [Aneurinibacillus sp. B1]WCN39317.1 YheC/YheD family protein [Aneurinibacillus sp. B1]